MVNFIKRDKNDLYSKPILGFLFKNQKFLLTLKLVVLGLFLYALYFGFAHTGKDNTFTYALFWGIFWSLFMVVTLPTFGRVFCGICPHGFMGKYITKFGLKKKMPKWMQNRFIGLSLLVIAWWGVYYMFPSIYRTPFGTAMMFTVMTLVSFVVYFIYKEMSYCKYICPIGVLTRAYSKLSFTWLGTYKSACNECTTFECATACPHGLKPFTFDSRNSMTDCTLCMDCSSACEAISFKVTKPSFSMFSKFQTLKAEVWAFVLILASISITMSFHHGIGRSNAAGDMIWSTTAEFFKAYVNFGSIDSVGLFAFIYAILFTIAAAHIGMYIASKILQKDFKSTFYNLGYSYAPLFILGSIAHSLETFFIKGYEKIVEGFAHGFGFEIDVASLAQRGDSWLHIFDLLIWVAIFWALLILYKRMKLLNISKTRKILAYPFAASLIIFFLSVNMYRGYIIKTYGIANSGHTNHKASRPVKKFNTPQLKIANKASATDIIYFTDKNPASEKTKNWNMHGGSYGQVPSKKVWPIFYNNFGKINCIDDIQAELYLLDTDLKVSQIKQSRNEGCQTVSFKMPENGYYNLFYSDKNVKDKTLYHTTAKYEYMRFNHSNDAVYDENKMAAHTIKEVPFDILRLREDNETFYHRLYTGDKIRIKAVLNSQSVVGANITLSTETGWSKTIKTDKDGIATFVLLQDYFPEWSKFDKRHESKFFLTASYTENIDGEYLGNKYKNIKHAATYQSVYYPNSSAYTSYAYGLLAALTTILLSGLAIYWYRKRKEVPFKEVRFDEKN